MYVLCFCGRFGKCANDLAFLKFLAVPSIAPSMLVGVPHNPHVHTSVAYNISLSPHTHIVKLGQGEE